MANYQQLKAAIDQVIKANGKKEITGPVLNYTLKAIVNSLGAGYQFMGVATPSTNPGTPDQNVFYIAGQAGTYANFNSIVLLDGVSIIKWNGSWSSETVVAGDGVFDISAYKATGGTLATFADLSAALDGGNNIPSALRKGGMSVKFVQSSDNKYVQYFLTKNVWSASEADWEKMNLEEEVREIRIPITAWGTNWDGQITEAGQYGYNPTFKLLKKCISFRTTAEASIYEIIPFNGFTLYVYNGRIYVWDGTQLIDRTTNLSPDEITKWINSFGIINNGFIVYERKGVKANDGIVVGVSELSITDFIDVSTFKTIFYANACVTGATSPWGMAFYDESKQYISGNTFIAKCPNAGYTTAFLTVPDNAKYARFSFWNESDPNFGVEALKQSFWLLGNSAANLFNQIQELAEFDSNIDLMFGFDDSRFNIVEYAGAINYSTGATIVSPECHYTDYVDISGNQAIVVNFLCVVSPLSVAGIAFYDSEKNFISGQRAELADSVSYKRTVFVVPKNAKYVRCTLWNSSYSGMSQFANKFYIYGYDVAKLFLEEIPSYKFEIPATTWIATTRNYILKLENDYLYHSDDLGVTWTSIENTIGDIMFVHWFADGTCLICGEEKAFTTKDFTSLVESTIYDYDGSPFAGGSHNFFHEFSYNNPYNLIDGKETVVWTDYDNSQGYISRLWMSDDNGQTIRCILKNGESIVDGEILSITHFHHCVWDKYAQCLWVSSGDYNNGNKLIKGIISNGVWTFTTIAQGNNFKYGMIMYDETYLYLITDITHGDAPRGLVKVNKDSINDVSAYSYIYKNPDNISFISYYESNGIKLLFPDGAASNKGKVYIADGDVRFEEYDFVCSDGQNRILGQSVGPNYNGDLIAITYYGYGSGYKLNMPRYLLSEGIKNAGFANFSKVRLV